MDVRHELPVDHGAICWHNFSDEQKEEYSSIIDEPAFHISLDVLSCNDLRSNESDNVVLLIGCGGRF